MTFSQVDPTTFFHVHTHYHRMGVAVSSSKGVVAPDSCRQYASHLLHDPFNPTSEWNRSCKRLLFLKDLLTEANSSVCVSVSASSSVVESPPSSCSY